MSVLGWLTVGWAAVLVMALAVSLTAIALQLRRTDSLLVEALEALERVRDHTAGLEEPLIALEDAAGDVAGEAAPAVERLRDLEAHLEEVLDRLRHREGAPS